MNTIEISEARWRQKVQVEGRIEVVSIRNEYLNAAVLEIRITDDRSSIEAVFLGYRKISGVKLGAIIQLHGLVINWGGRLTFLNPEYSLIPVKN